MNNAIVTVRTDKKLKESVGKIFSRIGLTHSSAVNIFFRMVEENKGIPFELKIPNETTVNAMGDVLRGKVHQSSGNISDLLK